MTDLANKIELITTADGSKSLLRTDLGETYHSRIGALTESRHVFIKHGLLLLNQAHLRVLEIGYGTGLNALVAAEYAHQNQVNIDYCGIELHPVPAPFVQLPLLNKEINSAIEQAQYGKTTRILTTFQLQLIQANALTYPFPNLHYHCIFLDAFAPNYQAEMWQIPFFQNLHQSLQNGGLLTTYCAQGQVRRNLQAVGFTVKKMQGPPGKREMMVAYK